MEDRNVSKLAEAATKSISGTAGFEKAYRLVMEISRGHKVYIIGGIVYRGIVNEVYGQSSHIKDIDFLTMGPFTVERDYPGWDMVRNSYGNPRLMNDKLKMDITSIDQFERLHPGIVGIESYFKNCLLNVQAIAFDPQWRMIVGEVGINALFDRVVRVNNSDTLQKYAKMKGFDPTLYVLDVGKSLGFEVEL